LAADVLQDDDRSLTDRVKAYKQLKESLEGNAEALKAFEVAYSE
jgi:hypothetical protein